MMDKQLLADLLYLEAIAEQQSFTAAASAMGVSQSAISQSIKRMEAQLGFPLLERTTRRMRFTPQGERLLLGVRKALGEIKGALDQIHSEREEGVLRVETFSTFGMYWLLPRLPEFHKLHPGIRVYLNTEESIRPAGSSDADVMLRFSSAPPSGFFSQALGTEQIFPVCSPLLLQQYPDISAAEMLRQATLLATANDGSDNCMKSWAQWSRRTGIDVGEDIIYFSRTELVLQAAQAGQGVALGRTYIVADAIANGSLIALDADPIPAPFTYYFATPYERADWPKVKKFREWLMGLLVNSSD
ncbi:LysR substrate-binding domain-containing protein [Hahella sp. CR1]|uniref:LysR substrate-binding domain-containing protein n=1 Tax=Hahella sp. CR1 TaxID=2992807 RepID=UPI0024423FC7|nr:LysR substrate-binding domain-containing protein [Hahella sp. CR1]MDG9670126.1 LysR substrate-binding domain-containing protein [Hahella sp. CR1]